VSLVALEVRASGSLSVTRTATTLTVTSAGVFEILFDQTRGGAVTTWYDLKNDPGRTTNLISTHSASRGLFIYFYRSPTDYSSIFDDLTLSHSEHRFVLLNSSPSVVELLIQGHMHQLAMIPDDAEGLGTLVRQRWTIYPDGAIYLDFYRSRKPTAPGLTVTLERVELVANYSTSWVAASESTDPMPGSGAAGDDFVMLHSDNDGADSHWADPVLGSYQDLSDLAPEMTNLTSTAPPPDRQVVRWTNDSSHPMASGSTIVARFLLRLSPTNLERRSEAAPYVADFRNPDLLSFTTGSAWLDSNENTGAADHFNEAQGNYPADFNPASGLQVAVDGGTNRRFQPPLKIRQWRTATDLSSVSFTGGRSTWNAVAQTGDPYPVDDVNVPDGDPDTYRTLIKAPFISRSGSEIRIKIRGHSSLATTNLSNFHIAEADPGDDRNVVDATWTAITFGGLTSVNIPAGGSVWSDWIPFTLDEAKTYSITNLVPPNAPSSEWWGTVTHKYYSVVDISNTLDWSAQALSASPRIDFLEDFEVRGTFNLASGTEFVSSIKPISDADFTNQVLFHTTLENFAQVSLPDIGDGTGSAENNMSYGAGRYGGGATFDSTTDWISVPLVVGGIRNIELDRGRIEFWYRPNNNHDDNQEHYLFDLDNDGAAGGVRIRIKKESDTSSVLPNALTVEVSDSGGTFRGIEIPVTNYTWKAGDWIHLAMDWDSTGPTDNVNLYMNGVELVPLSPNNTPFTMEAENPAGVLRLGNKAVGPGFWNADGVLDEFTIYDSPAAVTQLADGGLSSSSAEYLNRGNNNFPLAFAALNVARQGQYVQFGSDSRFRGLNVALATAGVGSGLNLFWEYWNGSNWANLEAVAGFTDQTAHLTANGTVYWTADPTGWAPYSVNGGPDLFYVRASLASGTYSTPPSEGVIRTDILLFKDCGVLTSDAQIYNFAVPPPTAVELAAFTASGIPGGIRLDWRTASETDNVGFHLHRADSRNGPYTRITGALIAGLGSSPAGRAYVYEELRLEPGRTYYYKLEDLETTGRTMFHGPVSATVPPAVADGPPSAAPETFGQPGEARLELLPGPEGAWTVRLHMPGFRARRIPEGLRLELPGFIQPDDAGAIPVPVREVLVPAGIGLRLRISDVRGEEEVLSGFDLAPIERRRARASRRGVVALAREPSPQPPGHRLAGLYPDWRARIAGVEVLAGQKYLRLRLAPLRWDPATGELAWSPRLEVQVVPGGRDREDRRVGSGNVLRTRARAPRRVPAAGVLARLAIERTGLYRLTRSDLSRAGIAADLKSLSLSYGGEPIAGAVLSESSGEPALYFYGRADLNPYDRGSVYEVHASRTPLRMRQSSEPSSGPPANFVSAEARFEEDRYYQAALVEASDLWLWEVVLSGTSKAFSFHLDHPVPAAMEARLCVELQGVTDLPADPDHHLVVRLNGVPVGEGAWNGKSAYRIEASIPARLLVEENALELENLGDTGASYSMIFLNRFSILYPRSTAVAGDRFEALPEKTERVTVSGFGARPLPPLDLNDPRRPVLLSHAVEPSSDGRFRSRWVAPAGSRIFQASAASVLSPRISRAGPPARVSQTRARYVVVGPGAFAPVLEPLLALRRSQLGTAAFVSTEDIYAEFGFGNRSPDAIREFVAFVYEQSQGRLEYLLLAGDASYDFKNRFGLGDQNLVPAPLRRSRFLWTASDAAFGAVNGQDDLPDLKVGRLPAARVAELQGMVKKILAYEQASVTDTAPAVIVADNPDAAGDFERDAEELIGLLSSRRKVVRLYLSQHGPERLRTQIAREFDSGASLLAYLGHGGIDLWAQENVWNRADVTKLAPVRRKPLLLALNCLNGYFHFPYFDSLAESLLKAEDKGAIAVIAPSGLGLNENAVRLARLFFQELERGETSEIGEIFLRARAGYAREGGEPDLLAIYTLFGDPAQRLR
jgi:hypothetical protein